MTRSALVEPAFHWCPPYTKTYGDEVIDLAKLAGFTPDPEQELALNDLFAVDPRGRSTAFEFAVVCARQNLKTGLFKQAALGWLFITDQNLVVWSAHEFSTAQEAFRDMTILIEGCPDLDRRVKQIHRGNGDEAIELLSGQRLKFKARTKGGGRGLTGNKVVLDEAFALQPVHMGALLPTLSAVPDPQVVYGSSAGLADSLVLRGIRDRGRPGGAPSLAYVEWCDDLPGDCETPGCEHARTAVGCRLDDPRRWARGNPQMGRRITVEYIAAERQALPPDEFGRERHGWWDEPDEVDAVISAARWAGCLDAESKIVSAPRFALDVSPEGDYAAIVAGGLRDDGLPHVEVTSTDDGRIIDHRPGTDWVVPRLIDLSTRWDDMTVTIAAGGGAAALKPEIEAVGIAVTVIPTGEMAAACAMFYGKVTAEHPGLRHIGQAALTLAATKARRRDIGDNAWTFGRRKSTPDITPLYGATLVVWALATNEPDDVSVFGFDDLDLCDKCGLKPHEDPEGDHEYLCQDCRPMEDQ